MKRCIALFQHGWADWEAGCILAALREHFGFEVVVATPAGADVTSIGGVRAGADLSFEAAGATKSDLILAIGSDAWMRGEDAHVSRLLRQADGLSVPIGAICAGTVAAAQAGLLNDRAHTSNERGFLQAQAPGYRGADHYQDSYQAVTGRRLVTASGMAPISFALSVLRLVSPDNLAGIDSYETLLRREHRDVAAHPPS